MNVLDRIVERRRARVAAEGPWLHSPVLPARIAPLVPFAADPFLICEVKRRSPSRGDIVPAVDVVEQARAYEAQGVRCISVLTEEDEFGGSLEDITRIKAALPEVAVLRKDFLLDERDIETSFRAGADAVLLIAKLHDEKTLAGLHRAARRRGLAALVEVHDAADVERCRSLAPDLTGINCRDLTTFSVDLAHPLTLRPLVTWKTRLIFESGVKTEEDVRFALSAGFSGVLVGEAAMRSVETVDGLREAFTHTTTDFWPRLYARRRNGRPLVKVCGITRREDAKTAIDLGADALGFVMAPSKRRASIQVLRDVTDLNVLKVAVVVTDGNGGARRLEDDVATALREGLVDAIQFHGQEAPEECATLAFPYYKAVRVNGMEDVRAMGTFRCPRVLADAWSADAAGGTGKRIPGELARAVRDRGPLWLAGGIGPDNVGEVLSTLHPELIDASSRLEDSSGVKDRGKLEVFFREIEANGKV